MIERICSEIVLFLFVFLFKLFIQDVDEISFLFVFATFLQLCPEKCAVPIRSKEKGSPALSGDRIAHLAGWHRQVIFFFSNHPARDALPNKDSILAVSKDGEKSPVFFSLNIGHSVDSFSSRDSISHRDMMIFSCLLCYYERKQPV